MTQAERDAEIERLEAMKAASLSMGGGYKARIAKIDERLAELRSE